MEEKQRNEEKEEKATKEKEEYGGRTYRNIRRVD